MPSSDERVPRQAVEAQRIAAASGTSLSWADTMKAGMAAAQLAGDVQQPPLIYSSRTHSQLTQVIRELRRTSYKCDVHRTRSPSLLRSWVMHSHAEALAGAHCCAVTPQSARNELRLLVKRAQFSCAVGLLSIHADLL